VVGLDWVVRVLLGDVVRGGQQLVEYAGVGRCSVGGHLAGLRGALKSLGEEPAGGRQVWLGRDQDVDDLPGLVHRPIQIDPPSGDLDIGLVDEPAVTGGVSSTRHRWVPARCA